MDYPIKESAFRMHSRIGLLCIALAFGLSSCSMAPSVTAPESRLPESFDADGVDFSEDVSAKYWWRAFGDAQLNALIDTALVVNLDLEMAASRVLEVQQAHRITRAAQLPGIQAGVDGSRQNTPTNTGPTGRFAGSIPGFPDRFDVTSYSASLTLGYELDIWGKARASSKAALSNWIGVQADYRAIRMGIIAEVIATYFEIRDQEHLFAAIEQQVDLLEERQELTAVRYERGLASSFELYAIQQSFDELRTQAPLVEASLFDAQSRLGILLGRTPGEVMGLITEGVFSLPALPQLPDMLPSELIRSRPDVMAAEARMEATRQMIGVRRAEQFPSFSLTASGGTQSNTLGDLAQTSQKFWLFGVSLTAPVFAAGARRAAVKVAWAQYEQAALAYEKAILTAFRDVSAALVLLSAEQQRYSASQSSLNAAGASLDLMNRRFARGVGDYGSLIDSELNHLRAATAMTTAQRSNTLARLTLYRAIGGKWVE